MHNSNVIYVPLLIIAARVQVGARRVREGRDRVELHRIRGQPRRAGAD